MFNLEYFASFAIISIAIDQFVKNNLVAKILNTILIFGSFLYAEIQVFYVLPIMLAWIVNLKNVNIPQQTLKLVTFLVILFGFFDDTFWKILLILFLYIYPLMFDTAKSKKVSLITVNTIYSISIFFIGSWLLYLNGETNSIIYKDFQLPVALALLIISLTRSCNILDSVKVMDINDKYYNLAEKTALILINKFYIPVFILDIIRSHVNIMSSNNIHYLSVFSATLIIISAFKHFYEIVYAGRKCSNISLIFNYFASLFFLSNIFIAQEHYTQVIGTVTYLIVVYIALIFIEKNEKMTSFKPLLVLVFLPTPLSWTFYQSIKTYNQLTLANFPLMASTFILVIVFSFLLKIDLFGKHNLRYDELPDKT